jgi:hypothetical protein
MRVDAALRRCVLPGEGSLPDDQHGAGMLLTLRHHSRAEGEAAAVVDAAAVELGTCVPDLHLASSWSASGWFTPCAASCLYASAWSLAACLSSR